MYFFDGTNQVWMSIESTRAYIERALQLRRTYLPMQEAVRVDGWSG